MTGVTFSRRSFIGAAAMGLAAAALPGPVRRVAAHGPSDAGGSRVAPASSSPVQGSRGLWIEREYFPDHGGIEVFAWQCPTSGAALVVTDTAVRLDEPGWGERWFSFAEFGEGHPQAAVRRLFGTGVADELERAVAARLNRLSSSPPNSGGQPYLTTQSHCQGHFPEDTLNGATTQDLVKTVAQTQPARGCPPTAA